MLDLDHWAHRDEHTYGRRYRIYRRYGVGVLEALWRAL